MVEPWCETNIFMIGYGMKFHPCLTDFSWDFIAEDNYQWMSIHSKEKNEILEEESIQKRPEWFNGHHSTPAIQEKVRALIERVHEHVFGRGVIERRNAVPLSSLNSQVSSTFCKKGRLTFQSHAEYSWTSGTGDPLPCCCPSMAWKRAWKRLRCILWGWKA